MKKMLFPLMLIMGITTYGQDLELHYDFRHSTDPKNNERNFLFLNFNYFKELDTTGKGTFQIQVQSQLNGEKGSIGQTFIQLFHNVKYWKPKIYLSGYFSGGLGVTSTSFGYNIANAYGLGLSVPLIYPKTWFNFGLLYRYSATAKPGHDPQINFYVGGGLFGYRLMYSSSIVFWTPAKDNGLPVNAGKSGRKVSFFGDPQIWYGIGKKFSIGSRINLYYHIITDENKIMLYPTIGIKRKF